MAGFAILYDPSSSKQTLETEFRSLLDLTGHYKQLNTPATPISGSGFLAAKLDSSASIHPGIVRDNQTGSWLMAAGTVVALERNNHSDKPLQNLLHTFIKHGSQALNAYDGHFALIVYNAQDESLSVISDPIGLFSIFYYQQGDRMLISSSALAIASHLQAAPDPLSAEHFLRMGRLDADKTLWLGVKRILAGTELHLTRHHFDQTTYYTPTVDVSIANLSFKAALAQATDMLTGTFSHALQHEEETWVDLTGGFDSRLAAMLTEKSNVPFYTYCMGPADSQDVIISQEISRELGWNYLHSQLPEKWEQDQFTWFPAALGHGDGLASTLRLAVTLRGFASRNTSTQSNVMGIGGENWRAYYWRVEGWNFGRSNKVHTEALLDELFPAYFPTYIMEADRSKEIRRDLSDFAENMFSHYSAYPNSVQLDRFEIYRDAGHGGAYLSATAAFGRSLAPFCFKEAVNFALSLNYRWKFPRHHVFIRTMLERENKRLASFPTTTGGPALPMRVTNMIKFSPLWKRILNRGLAISSKKILGKTIEIWPLPHPSGYPLPSWRKAFYAYAQAEGMFNFDKMHSRALYRRDAWQAFINPSTLFSSPHQEVLDRVISVEMAMRAVGTGINEKVN